MRRTVLLISTLVAMGCNQPASALPTVAIFADASTTELTPVFPPPHDLACTIPFDREEMNHMVALDECLGASRSSCWSGCESTCSSCGVACARDPACEAHCLAERDTCKTHHCADVHTQCRAELVRDWLSNKCDSVCAPLHAATPACNPSRCDALLAAPERKTLDPRWRANSCDAVCNKVWQCAAAQCSRSSCGEPIKMYASCAARVAGAGACNLIQSQGLCPEP
jgi:hypothetical protein